MKLTITRDTSGAIAYGLPFTTDNYQMKLSASTVKEVTAPTKYAKMSAVFSYESGSSVWVARNPASNISAPSGNPVATVAQMNPPMREVYSGDTIQFVTSNTTAEVGVSFYEMD